MGILILKDLPKLLKEMKTHIVFVLLGLLATINAAAVQNVKAESANTQAEKELDSEQVQMEEPFDVESVMAEGPLDAVQVEEPAFMEEDSEEPYEDFMSHDNYLAI